LGERVYDGRQAFPVREEIDLHDFIGFDNVEFRFIAWSGGLVSTIVEDGFYFTDFEIYTSRRLHCENGLHDPEEDGIDCGGDDCAPCATCVDGIHNGTEDDIDCGGSCAPCPTCVDGIQNGDEDDIDCGGSCTPCPTCADGIQNGDETGIDCGGTCATCVPTCSDGIQNGDEDGVDCGGSCPYACKTHCCARESRIWYDNGLSIVLAPNPVDEYLSVIPVWEDNIEHPAEHMRWEMLSVTGIRVGHGQIASDQPTNIDVSGLNAQIYIIRISDTEGRVVMQRFVKTE
jgi:hypothetical protein